MYNIVQESTLKTIRPEIKESTLKRLCSSGKYPPNTAVDYMINDVLDKMGVKK